MLNLGHLKYFYDAFHFASLAEAARRNYVSRPAISQAIRTLEDYLGEKLVDYQGKKAILTPKGTWLFEQSRNLLQQAKLIEQQIHGNEPDQAKPVKIGCSRSLAERFLGGHEKSTLLAHTGFSIDIRLGDHYEVRRALETGDIDFGLAMDDGNFALFDPQTHYRGQFELCGVKSCGHPDHLLIGDKGLEVNAFINSPSMAHFTRVTSIQSWNLLASFAHQGIGRAWVPSYLREIYPDLTNIKMAGIPKFEFNIVQVTSPRRQLSHNAKIVLKYLTERRSTG